MTTKSEQIKERAARVLMNTYGGRYDLVLESGRGARVYDPEGREYHDFLSGLAVASLGHAHPGVAESIAAQARRLVHVSNLYFTEPQVRLAEILVEHSFADKVFFANSGAEANEAALKLARKYSYEKYGPDRYKILSLQNSFHGRTMATLSATGQAKIHKGFTPLVDGFAHLPGPDSAALEQALTDDVCAFILEPIQGEGGINPMPDDFLKTASELCRAKDVLLIFDEVQVGLGRTGTLFAYQQTGVQPDVMTLAKALANGLPMGAALARDEVAEVFGPGSHATTFGGGPVVAAAALAVLETMLEPGFLDSVVRVGAYFKSRLSELVEKSRFAAQVRGRGLILGLELTFPGDGVRRELAERGFLINCTSETVLRFLPPLIIDETDADRLTPVLAEVVEKMGTKWEAQK